MIETDIALRPATLADAGRIAALFTDEGYPVGGSAIEARLGWFGSVDSTVIVADREGEILGFIALHVVPRFEHDESIVRVVALVVDSSVRGRGIGGALMAEAERFGQAHESAFVEVTAGHHRPDARHLYESLGYDASLTAYLRKRLPGR
jgi:GNAT superfamily N-acetyltransferase